MRQNNKNLTILALIILFISLLVSLTIVFTSSRKGTLDVADQCAGLGASCDGTSCCNNLACDQRSDGSKRCVAPNAADCNIEGQTVGAGSHCINNSQYTCSVHGVVKTGCCNGATNVNGSCVIQAQVCAGKTCADGALITTPGGNQCKCLCSNGNVIGNSDSCGGSTQPPSGGTVGECGSCSPGGAITCASGTCCSCGKCGGVGKTCNQICNQNACGGGNPTTTTTTSTGGSSTGTTGGSTTGTTGGSTGTTTSGSTTGTSTAGTTTTATTGGTTATQTTTTGGTTEVAGAGTNLPATGVEETSMSLVLGTIILLIGFSLIRARKTE